MRRPLTFHSYTNVFNGLRQKICLMAIFSFVSLTVGFSQSITRAECECLGNGTTDSNGQFQETIRIEGNAGDTWTLVSSTDFYDINSPAPPAAPTTYIDGYVIPEGPAGVFILEGLRLNDTDWSVVLTDGTTQFPISSIHTCQLPASSDVIGDLGSCVGSVESYTIDADPSRIDDVLWTVTGGTILTSPTNPTLIVQWDAVGDFDVSYTADVSSYDGQSSDLCEVSGSATVQVMDEEAFAMACNNQVNISLNGNCDLDITADMVLEDMMFSNMSYDLVFRDIEEDTMIVGPNINMDYVNKIIEVKVVHECSGNSCWGNLLLEDKSIPALECGANIVIDCDEFMGPSATGFPLPVDAIITALGNNTYLVENFDKCSDVTLRYEDVPVSGNLCSGPFSSIINRRWHAVDNFGNADTCSQSIFVNRASLDDITFPDSYDDVLGPNPSLEACGNYPKLPNGYPDPSFTGRPMGVLCLDAQVTFEDTPLEKCGPNSYKLRRAWKVLSHCDGEVRTNTQNITIVDRTDPVCVAPAFFTVGATEYSCSSIIEVPEPNVTDCSDWTYTVSWNPVVAGQDPFFQPSNAGVVETNHGFLIQNLPNHDGAIWILYYITDDCGNMTTCSTQVEVIDDVQPIPVCDLYTYVALNENGIGYADVDAFDDGSWDNCALERLEVRRMTSACGESANWRDKVKFCCSDVGNTVMVSLRATDKSGNSNTCMVEVEVQDNKAPEFTFCPANTTVDCDDDIVNLAQYGIATAEDNCNVTITESVNRAINACGIGTVTRRFIATDDQGNSDDCIQRIFVENLNPFYVNPNNPNDPNDDIIWPGDHTVANGCVGSGTNPEDLPVGKQEPLIVREGCSNVSFTYNDVIFQYTDEACLKILRTWKVIDDCVYVPFGNVGFWEYTQVIKVENSTAPTINSGCNAADYTIEQVASCSARVTITAEAEDDCTEEADLEYRYRIDLDRDGSVDFAGNGKSINRIVPFGNHSVTWFVEDECGNIRECTANLTVNDNKPPTPYCLTEVVTVIMETTGTVAIWASDFDLGSFDDCSSTVLSSFSPDFIQSSLQVNCDDLDSTATTLELNVYFTDESNNQDFCTVRLIVQDNNNVCGFGFHEDEDDNESSRVALGGHFLNMESEAMENVDVELSAVLPEFPHFTTTNSEGEYVFENLPGGNTYSVVPQSNDDYYNGVSTLDIVMIQRHILGIQLLDSPYKVIAADVNDSESLTVTDLLTLRKLILGIYSEFPKSAAWKFVDASFTFDDESSPWPFVDAMQAEMASEDKMNVDFVAVKVGDVNNSATNLMADQSTTVRSAQHLKIADQELKAGYNEVMISTKQFNEFFGLQANLHFATDVVTDVSMSSSEYQINEGNYTFENGALAFSISGAQPLRAADEAFALGITVAKDVKLSEVLTEGRNTIKSEIYFQEDDRVVARSLDVVVEGKSLNTENYEFELLNNVPNPFESRTTIGFVLPADEMVHFKVYDVAGKVAFTTTGKYQKGYNEITLDVGDINASGVLYYQLDTESNSATKKMILVK